MDRQWDNIYSVLQTTQVGSLSQLYTHHVIYVYMYVYAYVYIWFMITCSERANQHP